MNLFSLAACKLLRGSKGHQFRPLATQYQGEVKRAILFATGRAAGRLRASLVNLAQ